jgi:hypothetical protein
MQKFCYGQIRGGGAFYKPFSLGKNEIQYAE